MATMETADFAFAGGGLLARMERRLGYEAFANAPSTRGALLVGLGLWLPLLVASAITGHLLGPAHAGPFLLDFATHVRMLIAVPLMLIGERVANARVGAVINHLRRSELLDAAGVRMLDARVAHLRRWCDFGTLELVLLVAIYAITFGGGWSISSSEETAWAGSTTAIASWTPAGFWLRLLALPLFQFLLVRWLWRIFAWMVTLARLTRVPFRLVAGHPDRSGGIGVISESTIAFVPFLVAGSAVLSATFTRKAIFDGVAPQTFERPVAVLLAFVLCIFLGPLAAFAQRLGRLKREGVARYSELGTRYVQGFEQRWLTQSTGPESQSLLGTPDIQALADLRTSFEGVRRARLVPFGGETVLLLAVATLAPMLPLVLVAIPVTALVRMLVSNLIKP